VTEYLAGMVVAAGTPPPEGLEARTVPGGEYAVFECPVDAIGATYQYIFSVWLPARRCDSTLGVRVRGVPGQYARAACASPHPGPAATDRGRGSVLTRS